jgi:broad specificity phosphatase PhoE
MTTETRLLLVRHGATEDFEAGRLQGQRRNGGLSAAGRAQVERLAASLAGLKIAVIYSSDLARAAESAALLQREVQAPLRLDARLREADFGAWEGMRRAELQASYPDEPFPLYGVPYAAARYGGEPVDALFARARAAYTEIVAKHAGDQIMIVAHAHLLSAVIYNALGLSVGDRWALGLEPAHSALLLVGADGRAFLRL